MYLDYRPYPVTDFKIKLDLDPDTNFREFTGQKIERRSSLVTRRYYRNQMRKLGVHKITAKVHCDDFFDLEIRTRLNENFLYKKPGTGNNYPLNEFLTMGAEEDYDPELQLNELEKGLLPEYFFKGIYGRHAISRRWDYYNHPVHDLQYEWIWKVEFLDAKNQRISSNRRHQILAAKYLKGILRYHERCNFSWQHFCEYQSMAQGKPKDEILAGVWSVPWATLQASRKLVDFYADLTWELESDELAYENIVGSENLDPEKSQQGLSLLSDYTCNNEDQADWKTQKYFRGYLRTIWDKVEEQDRFVISLRQNNFLEKGEFCPVRNQMRKLARDPESKTRFDPRTAFLHVEFRRKKNAGAHEFPFWISKQYLFTRFRPQNITYLPRYVVEHTAPGFEEASSKTLQPRSQEIPESLELRRISQEFCKEISKVIRTSKCTKFQTRRDLKESLKTLQNHVHPLIPRAWKNHKGEIETCLEHGIYSSDIWNMNFSPRPGVWSEVGLFSANFRYNRDLEMGSILTQSGRRIRAQVLTENILYNLDWPVSGSWMRDLNQSLFGNLRKSLRFLIFRKKSSVSLLEEVFGASFHGPLKVLVKRYVEKFEQALEKFVLAVNDNPEIAQIASQNHHLDYAKACRFLKSNRNLIPAVRRNPYLLQVCLLGEDQEKPRGKIAFPWKEIQNLVSPDDERWNLQMTIALITDLACVDFYGDVAEPEESAKEYLQNWMKDPGNFPRLNEVPLAMLRKIVQGLPIHAPNIQTIFLENISRKEMFPDEKYSRASFYHQKMKNAIRFVIINLELAQIPENVLEWDTVATFADPLEHGRNIPTIFWKDAVHQIRLPVDKNLALPNSLPTLVERAEQRYGVDCTDNLNPSFHVEVNEKYLKPCKDYTDLLDRVKKVHADLSDSPYRDISPIKELLDTHLEPYKKGMQELEAISSLKKITKIAKRQITQFPMLNHIDHMCHYWPEENISWMPVLEEPMVISKYHVREIHSAKDLRIHGMNMEHCIGAYMSDCLFDSKNLHVLAIANSDMPEDNQDIVTFSVTEYNNLGVGRIQLSQIQTRELGDLSKPLQEVVRIVINSMNSKIRENKYSLDESRKCRRESREKIEASKERPLHAKQRLWRSLHQWSRLSLVAEQIPDPGKIQDSMILDLPPLDTDPIRFEDPEEDCQDFEGLQEE